ncbi:hypothetical protein [Streptomyces sindenensis]|uniref:Uncharacterized protein n=1 Tax=Streptomyces sindenensis TaxID=67363 RepID=A0ABW6EDU9_9ACTN
MPFVLRLPSLLRRLHLRFADSRAGLVRHRIGRNAGHTLLRLLGRFHTGRPLVLGGAGIVRSSRILRRRLLRPGRRLRRTPGTFTAPGTRLGRHLPLAQQGQNLTDITPQPVERAMQPVDVPPQTGHRVDGLARPLARVD